MFGTGLGVRLRRLLGGWLPAPATQAAVQESFEPRRDLDWDALAASAGTALERAYYSHRGRKMQKWRQYLPVYDRVLAPYVGRTSTLVEIGLGGGGSVELWRAFLGPGCRVIGCDISSHARFFEREGVEILIGDQGDPAFLDRIAEVAGPIDILIDDGSHRMSDQILTFGRLFPHVKAGGVYVCEDLHTSYWPDWGGGPGRTGTFVEYLKAIVDRMHGRYHGAPPATSDPARWVESLLIADSIAVLHKAEPRTDNVMIEVGADR